MEVIEQLGVDPAQGHATEFAGESAVADVGRAPEVAAGGHGAELHHPGVAPQVVGLLGAVVVGDVVLPEVRRHAVQKRQGMRAIVEVQQLDHAAGGHRGLGDIAHRPGHVVVRVGLVKAVDAAQRVVRV